MGESVLGCVVLETSEPIKLRGVKVFLRGRARAQWKILKSGESRMLKDDQYLLDEKVRNFWIRSEKITVVYFKISPWAFFQQSGLILERIRYFYFRQRYGDVIKTTDLMQFKFWLVDCINLTFLFNCHNVNCLARWKQKQVVDLMWCLIFDIFRND